MKKIKRLLAVLTAAAAVFGLSSCGKLVDGIDTSKTQIYVGIFNGGYGTDWLKEAAAEFNAMPNNSEYQVFVSPINDDSLPTIEANLVAGTSNMNVYFTTMPNIKSMISKNLLADLSDLLPEKPDGEDGLTLEEKMLYPDLAKKAFSDPYGDGFYAFPYGDSFVGFVFDYQEFYTNGWLIFDAPGKLSPGPDGDPGTYDDGQPRNMSEWNEIMLAIRSSGTYPFIHNTKYPDYLTAILDAGVAQYEGAENYRTFYRYDGTYTDGSGNTSTITPATGNKVFAMEGVGKALGFFDDMFTNNRENVHPASWETTSLDHRETQNKYILRYKNSDDNPPSAFLVDGNWWENEAKPLFNNLTNSNEPERGYGKREFRYMLLPRLDGSKTGADGKAKSVLCCNDTGAMFVVKNKDAALEKKAKEFVAFTLSEKNLKRFTLANGAIRPYHYDLKPEEKAQLTPFQRNVWEMYHDTDHIELVRPEIEKLYSPINYATNKVGNRWFAEIGGAGYYNPLMGLRRSDAQTYQKSLVNYYTDTKWNGYYTVVKEYYDAWKD